VCEVNVCEVNVCEVNVCEVNVCEVNVCKVNLALILGLFYFFLYKKCMLIALVVFNPKTKNS
jgi:hypothetical protein